LRPAHVRGKLTVMRWMKTLTAALAAGLLAGAAQAGPVYVMRHLERDVGADPGLNATGAANAKRLAEWFRHAPPAAIYVTPYRRARETVAPLAAKLGLTPIEYDPRQQDELIEAVRAVNGSVLIVGHSNTVPAIVHALGGPVAEDLPDSDYGRIWIVRDGSVRVAPLAEAQPR
jgi:phosphohistidine phosphatase SixA